MQSTDKPKTGPDRPLPRSPEAASHRTGTDSSEESEVFKKPLSPKNAQSQRGKGNVPDQAILYDPVSYNLTTAKLDHLLGKSPRTAGKRAIMLTA